MNQQTSWKRILQVLVLSITLLSVWCFHISSEAEAAQKPSLANRVGKIVIGETLDIELKNVPEGAKVTYRTKNASVATVSEDGEVTGVKDGKTKVVIKITNGTAKTKLKYKVRVKKPTISLDGISVGLLESKTVIIKNQPKPEANAEYEWVSEDEEVAVVKDGVVTAKGPGETDIVVYISSDKFVYRLSQTVYVDAYTVTFDCDGGSEIEEQEIMVGGKVTVPSDPVLEGYVFMGWYSDYDCEEEYDFSAPVTEDHTIYAKWEEEDSKSYTVSFECYGGSYIRNQSVLKGEVPVEPNDPVLKGYTFAGWYLDEDLTEPYYFSEPLNESTILYAKWEENPQEENAQDTYTVAFRYYDGRDLELQMIEKGNMVERPVDPTMKGFTFLGWYTDARFKNEFDFSTPVESSFTLYAKWEQEPVKKPTEAARVVSVQITERVSFPYMDSRMSVGQTVDFIVEVTVFPEYVSQEVVWTSSDTSIATVDSNGVVTGVSRGTAMITATSVVDPRAEDSFMVVVGWTENLSGMEKIAKEQAEAIISSEGFDRLSSDIEKVKAVYDYLILNAEYDYENSLNDTVPMESYSAYGVLVLKTGVCESYAKAFQMCMELLDIPCEYVSGTAGGIGHAWNIVTLDGERYHVDATWGDPVPDRPGEVDYGWFLVDDMEMMYDHEWDTSSVEACTSTKYLGYAY